MDASEIDEKKSSRKGNSYKKYCYLRNTSEIPLRTKHYWAANKRKKR